MADAMEPIIGEIIGEKKQNPKPPFCVIKSKQSEFVNKTEQSKYHSLGKKTYNHISNAEPKAAESIFCFVWVFVFFISKPCFDGKQNNKTGNGVI